MIEINKSYINLLIKSAHTLFCYYNLSKPTINEFETLYGIHSWNSSIPFLKVSYVENGISKLVKIIQLDPLANNWYINIPENDEDKDIYLEYGRAIVKNEFIPILVSNLITTPRNHQSMDNNLYFLNIETDKFPPQNVDKTNTPKLETYNIKRKVANYPQIILTKKALRNTLFENHIKEIDINTISSSK